MPKFAQLLEASPPDPHLPAAAGKSVPRSPHVIHNLAERTIVAREVSEALLSPPFQYSRVSHGLFLLRLTQLKWHLGVPFVNLAPPPPLAQTSCYATEKQNIAY